MLYTMNFVLCLFFLTDFVARLLSDRPSTQYFFREYGWADLLSAVPIPTFQFFRIIPSWRTVRELQKIGGRNTVRDVASNRAGGALFLAMFLSLLVVEIASMTIVSIEATNPDANIKTAGDAIWWAYVTITTIGYGDRYPVTGLGRFVGALLISVGVALFSVLTGFVANFFLGPRNRSGSLVRVIAAEPPAGSIRAEIAYVLAQLDDVQSALTEQERKGRGAAKPADHPEQPTDTGRRPVRQ